MNASLRELERLEQLQVYSSESDLSAATTDGPPCISESLEALLETLRSLRQRVQTESSLEALRELPNLMELKKKEIDDKQKEIHTCLGRLGKTIDKVWFSDVSL